MNCCICGEPLENGDTVLRLTVYKFKVEDGYTPLNYTLLASKFQDGTVERLAHITCPIVAGAPMSLIGADGDRIDE